MCYSAHKINQLFKNSEFTDSPSPTDVVCARGRAFWEHEGNCRYRALIAKATRKYSDSTCKLEKSLVVSEVIEAVRRSNGRFIKKSRRGGPWVEVDELFVREKVGQALRDGLVEKYKSATKAKKDRRTKVCKIFNGDVDRVIHSNKVVSEKINYLFERVERIGSYESDHYLFALFLNTNLSILEALKEDASLLKQFQEATTAANNEVNHSGRYAVDVARQ
jgi:hypothetical protein